MRSARALPPMHHGGGVVAVIRGQVVNLASRDLADHDGGTDYVGEALLAFRTSGHSDSVMFSGKLRKDEYAT